MCAFVVTIALLVATVLIFPRLVQVVGAAILVAALLIAITAARAEPSWQPTGGWQCGPHVRIATSIDGRDGIDFYVTGAWFSNHFTLRGGQLFYNGVACAPFGSPFGAPPRPTPQVRPREAYRTPSMPNPVM
jgi:hypothetical protein